MKTSLSRLMKPAAPLRVIATAVASALLIGGAVGAFAVDGVSEEGIFRRNVSRTPALKTSKAKIGFSAPAYTEAATQNSDLNLTEVNPELCEGPDALPGAILTDDERCLIQPLVVSYLDENSVTGANDSWAAVSMDGGATWRRTNLSHSAEKLVVIDDVVYGTGATAKPALMMYDNNIMAAWTSYLCKGGSTGVVEEDANQGEVLGEGDPDDLYQVNGKQGFVDYSLLDRPDLGIRPYSCVWSARGVVQPEGTVLWYAPERHTSGRRDAYQLSVAVSGAGFAMTWQEDPEGLLPGQMAGPGHGMSGATVSKKTDIWYSFIPHKSFAAIDVDAEPNGDVIGVNPDGKPKVLNLIASPVRISDNSGCKVTYDEEGVQTIHGIPACELVCDAVTEPDENDLQFCIHEGVVLDADTGASRANVFMVGKELVIGYEETKGMGAGPNDPTDDVPMDEPDDLGKNVIYHHYPDFTKVNLANGATIDPGVVLNLPALDDNGDPMTTEDGELLYNNARRVRFLKQSLTAVGEANTPLVAIWREGAEGKGRQADIMMRRFVGGYSIDNLVCDETRSAASVRFRGGNGGAASDGKEVCIKGVYNVSSPQAGQIEWPDPADPVVEDGGAIPKVTDWSYTVQNLFDDSEANPFDDARAHRGILRGDFLMIGYTWTPNWAAARNGNDLYDFYIRRSFDGGKTLTDMMGKFEDPRNLSNLRTALNDAPTGDPDLGDDWDGDLLGIGRGLTAGEPRIMATPSTPKLGAGDPVNADDTQNTMVVFVSYGTNTNPDTNVTNDQVEEESVPQDIRWTYTRNFGETYYEVYNENNERMEHAGLGNMSRDPVSGLSQIQESEAQLRTNPAGTILFASWLAETDPVCIENCGPCIPGQDPGSDVCYRRIDLLDDLAPLALYDVDGDGTISPDDQEAVRDALGTDNATVDFNADGKVDRLVDEMLFLVAQDAYCARPDADELACLPEPDPGQTQQQSRGK